MNKFENQLEMVRALFEDGCIIIANTGEKYFMVEQQLNVEDSEEHEIIETNTLPDYRTSKIYLDRWHNDLKISDDGDFDDAILCHVGEDIRLVVGYWLKNLGIF